MQTIIRGRLSLVFCFTVVLSLLVGTGGLNALADAGAARGCSACSPVNSAGESAAVFASCCLDKDKKSHSTEALRSAGQKSKSSKSFSSPAGRGAASAPAHFIALPRTAYPFQSPSNPTLLALRTVVLRN